MLNIAILGYGVVGSGVAELLDMNSNAIEKKTGKQICVKKILDLKAFSGDANAKKFAKNYEEIVTDPDIKVVVEAMGGTSPAYEYVKAALASGKHVVTSNKEMVAVHGAELLRIAREQNVNFMFEGSVGGGIPIIRPLHKCLAANEVTEIAGILNGTTNFILTKMVKEDMAFSDALAIAQKLGYAEADPSADVEGLDACRKICILASLVFGEQIRPESVPTVGITAVTKENMRKAESMGCVIKLIGQARKEKDGKIYAMVSPALVPKENLLSGVDDVFNGVLVKGNAVGELFFSGRGAGSLPTASAVVADVIDCLSCENTSKTLFWNESDGHNVFGYSKDFTFKAVEF